MSLDSIQLNTRCGAEGEANLYFHAPRAETETLTIGVDLPSSSIEVGSEYNLKEDLIYWKNRDSYSLNTLSLDLYLGGVYPEDPLLAHFVVDWDDLPTNTLTYRQVKMFREGSEDVRCPSDSTDDPDSVILWLWAENIDPSLIDNNGLYVTAESTSSSTSLGMYLILGVSALVILLALCGPFYYFCCTTQKPPIVLYDDTMSQYSTDTRSGVSSVPPTLVSNVSRESHQPRRRRRYSRSPPPNSSVVSSVPSSSLISVGSREPHWPRRRRSPPPHSRSFPRHPPSTVHSRTSHPSSFVSVSSRPVSHQPVTVVTAARPSAVVPSPVRLTQHASVINQPVAFRPVVLQPSLPLSNNVVYLQNPV